MKPRHLVVLLVVFGLLVVLTVAKKAARGRQALEAARQAQAVVLTPEFDEDFIGRVILYKGDVPDDKKIVFSRRATGWVLANRNGIPAKKERVEELIHDVENVRGELRGVSETVFSDFGIADDQGVHVVLQGESGDEIAHLVYGVKMSRPGAGFCRLAGSEETLLVATGLPMSLGIINAETQLSDRAFVEGRIYSDEVKKAVRIDVTKAGQEPFSLIKGADETWTFDPPVRRQGVGKEKVDGLLKIVAEVEGRGLVDPEEGADYGFDAAAVRVVLTVEGEEGPRVFDIQVGEKLPDNTGMYFVKALPQDIIYQVPQNAAENLIVDRKDLAASPRKK